MLRRGPLTVWGLRIPQGVQLQRPGPMTNPMPRRTALPVVLLSALLFAGCHRGPIELIDLDRVLDILSEELKRPIDAAATDSVEIAKTEDGKVAGLEESAEKPEMTRQFLDRFAKSLNAAKLLSTPIGVRMDSSGSMYGFTDHDRNMQQNGAQAVRALAETPLLTTDQTNAPQ